MSTVNAPGLDLQAFWSIFWIPDPNLIERSKKCFGHASNCFTVQNLPDTSSLISASLKYIFDLPRAVYISLL